ncbi:MAG TPA: phosphate regulon sensor histidine kinase PhoR [Casimicrobiaceae bacterium]|nr:phosphate regulon sensor histidine kinase PhoR [Casimicrobiaceae bacterium]
MRRPSPLLLSAAAAPLLILAAALLLWAFVGGGWALALLVPTWGALLIHHIVQLDRFAQWAGGDGEASVPEGSGVWRDAMSALYRRMRARRAHERDLAHTIERFQSAAEAIPDGMLVLDTQNRIKWASARAQSLLGLDLAHDTGAPLVNLVRQPEFVRYLDAADYRESVLVDSHRDADVTLAIQIVPFGVAEKLLIARDVTHMEAVARMRRDFIANVSHELKTPLTVISGFVETLQELDLDERQRTRFLSLMREQAASMQRLVEDLLTLSSLESEHNTLAEEAFAVVPLMLALSADAKGLSHGQHEVTLEIGEAATILGSRDELASAFGNLVSNAIRYTPAGGTIALRWRIDADGAGVFSVMDSGIGIAPEHLPRLTERFYRIDRSRSRATGGTGLGLAIVKHVLLRHQADLLIASEPGKGSTFSVRLPSRRITRVPKEAENGAPSRSADTLPAAPAAREPGRSSTV